MPFCSRASYGLRSCLPVLTRSQAELRRVGFTLVLLEGTQHPSNGKIRSALVTFDDRVALTRKPSILHGSVSFGAFRLSAATRCLQRNGLPVQIGSRSLDILIALVELAGEVVSKKELLARVWPDVIVEDSSLRSHVAGLRKALGDGRDGARYIANAPGRGYCFVAPVTRAPIASQVDAHAAEATQMRCLRKRSMLPPRLARMVGRDDEVAAFRAELLDKRFVSIVGPGGMGKTTVALAVAHSLEQEFPHSIVYVDLTSIEHASLAPDAIASALGLALQSSDPVPALLGFLESQRLLLVLDNCEHVISSVAALAERIYLAASQVSILATSREPLRVEGEQIRPLLPLASPDDQQGITAAEALRYPAIELFMERAGAAGHRSGLTDTDAPTVATICRRLDGIALALELAASRVAAHGIRGTAQLLDQRFNLVLRGRRTAPKRHQTLRTLLDWSYNLLAQEETIVLRRLSVFVGTFSLHGVRAIAHNADTDPAQVAEILTNLVEKSLVSMQLRQDRLRYKLLEVTREYASLKLDDSGESESMARRHAVYYSQLEVEGSEFLDADYIGNVRAALQWCFSRPNEHRIGGDLVLRVTPAFLRLSLLEECHRWCERAITTLPDADCGTVREVDLLMTLAICSMFTRGNDPSFQTALEGGLRLAQALGDHMRELELLAGLNIFCIRVGDFVGAMRSAEQSAVIARNLSDPTATAIADWMLAVVHHLKGDQRAAQMYCERGFRRGHAFRDAPQQYFGYDHRIRALITLARTLWLRGRVDRASAVARQAIDDAATLDQPVSVCISLIYTATIYLWRGDWSDAEKIIANGLVLSKRHSLGPYHAVFLGLSGELLFRRRQVVPAIDLLRQAFAALTNERYVVLAPGCGTTLAEALTVTGQFDEALATVEHAMAQRDYSGASFDMPEMLRVKASILVSHPDSRMAEAMTCLWRAMELARVQSALSWELRIASTRLQMQTEDDDAREVLQAIRSRFSEGAATIDLLRADQLLGRRELARNVGT